MLQATDQRRSKHFCWKMASKYWKICLSRLNLNQISRRLIKLLENSKNTSPTHDIWKIISKQMGFYDFYLVSII